MFNVEFDKKTGESFFIKVLLVVLLFRLGLAAWLPITGDEAYFVLWGKNFDYGFYDHTPLVGWLLSALLVVSDAIWWLRLPSILLPIFISYAIYKILLKQHSEVALWVGLSFLVAPVNLINVLITTDTPLVFFSFISAWYFYKGISDNCFNYNNFILSGLFLGLAFFSKYFAVVLGLTYALYILSFKRNKRELTGLIIIVLMVTPFVFVNIFWNYNHCWNNILFNIFNRTAIGTDSLDNLIKYISILLYLFSPVLFFYVLKNKKNYTAITKQQHVYFWLLIFSLLLFVFVLLKKSIGLHWLLSFYPFVFISVASFLNVRQWRITFNFMFIISLIHIAVIFAILVLPINTFTSNKTTLQNFSFGKNPEKLLQQLKPYEDEYVFSTISYGMAAVASYYSSKHFIQFGEGSVHARQDDQFTNFKELNGKNILFFKRSKNLLDVYADYFESSEIKKIWVDDVDFELFLGKGFKYDLYRKDILSEVNKKYYSIPDWLPVGSCGFKEKYSLN